MKIHHVGCVSKNIDADLSAITKLFDVIAKTEIVYDELQEASVCLVKVNGGLDIELVSGNQVAHLAKKGYTYYHLCYEVDNINSEIERFIQAGAMLVSAAKPAKLFDGRQVAFLYTKIGLIELLQSDNVI